MKRTFQKLLGIIALAITVVTGSSVTTPAKAAVIETSITQNGVTCLRRDNSTYPENGYFFYCGDPNLPININNHKNGYISNLRGGVIPANVLNDMGSATIGGSFFPVEIFVFCTKYEADAWFATTIPVSAEEPAFYNKANNQLMIFQWLTSNPLGCTAPLAQRTAAYQKAYAQMDHEIGHYIDWYMNVPAGQTKHSVNISGKLYQQYLVKDTTWINDKVRAGGFIPCSNAFLDPNRDKFLAADSTYKQVCTGSVLHAELTGLSNFDIMKKMMPYFLTVYDDIDSATGLHVLSWRELFAESFNNAMNTQSTQPNTSATATYLFGSYFLCSTRYIEIVAKYNRVPNAGDLVSPWNRCVLP